MRGAASFQPVHRLEGWIAPADLYAAINTLAEQNPNAKHVCWDMLMLAHALPRTRPDSDRSRNGGDAASGSVHESAGRRHRHNSIATQR